MKRAFLFLFAMCLGFSAAAGAATKDEAAIKALLDHWAQAVHDHDVNAIMANYQPGDALVSYDLVPPLQYKGYDAYKKDYEEFLAQYDGPITIEFRDLVIETDSKLAFARGLERMTGTMKSGDHVDPWFRFTECYRKVNGHWLAVHDHVSVPVDLATGKAALDLKP